MALVLGLKEGESFYVDKKPVKVSKVKSANNFTLTIENEFASESFEINGESRVQILPEVYCSAGYGSMQQVRVLVEAPRHIKLLRGKHVEADDPSN